MVDLGSKMIGSGTNTNSGKSTLGSKFSFGARVSPNPRIKIHILSHQWNVTIQIGDSISISIGTVINVGSGNWSNLGKNTGVNIVSKMETESQSWGSGSHS